MKAAKTSTNFARGKLNLDKVLTLQRDMKKPTKNALESFHYSTELLSTNQNNRRSPTAFNNKMRVPIKQDRQQ